MPPETCTRSSSFFVGHCAAANLFEMRINGELGERSRCKGPIEVGPGQNRDFIAMRRVAAGDVSIVRFTHLATPSPRASSSPAWRTVAREAPVFGVWTAKDIGSDTPRRVRVCVRAVSSHALAFAEIGRGEN
jgi:hypothetical protein